MEIQDSQELKPLQKKRSDSPQTKPRQFLLQVSKTYCTYLPILIYLLYIMNINKSYSFDCGVRSLARGLSLIQLAFAAEDCQQATKATYSLAKMRTPDPICQNIRSYSYQSVHLHTRL